MLFKHEIRDRPFVKVHVNVDDILNQAWKYIDARLPDMTIFEGAATSDPVPVEPYTNSLQRAIEFFGKIENARFRFVTKYNDIDTFLNVAHNGHTEIRFSLNTASIIDSYEHFTASCDKRIEANIAAAQTGYPIGFYCSCFYLSKLEEEYHDLLLQLRELRRI